MDPNTAYIQLLEIVSDLHAIANRHALERIAQAVQSYLTRQPETEILIAVSNGIDSTLFEAWLVSQSLGISFKIVSLEGLDENPFPLITAEKALVLFECGRLFEGASIDVLQTSFFPRSLGSYAMVLSRAEKIADDEDLQLIERGAWRLLVPNPKLDWSQQALHDYNCFLWSHQNSVDFLCQRIAQDQEELLNWLQLPFEGRAELLGSQILMLIDIAKRIAFEHEPKQPSEKSARQTRQLLEARDQVSSIKHQILRYLDTATSTNERQVTAMLQNLERQLQDDLPSFLEQQMPYSKAFNISESDVKRLLTKYILAGIKEWEIQARQFFEGRSREILVDVHHLLEGIHWEVINALLNQQMTDHLIEKNLTNAVKNTLPLQLSPNTILNKLPGRSDERSLQTLIELSIVGASGIVAATFGGFLAGGIVGAIMSAFVIRRRHSHNLNEAYAHGQAVIRAIVRETIPLLQDYMHEALNPFRAQLVNELREIEIQLDRFVKPRREQTEHIAGEKNRLPLHEELREISRRTEDVLIQIQTPKNNI